MRGHAELSMFAVTVATAKRSMAVSDQSVSIDAALVNARVAPLAANADLSKFIL